MAMVVTNSGQLPSQSGAIWVGTQLRYLSVQALANESELRDARPWGGTPTLRAKHTQAWPNASPQEKWVAWKGRVLTLPAASKNGGVYKRYRA